ncbi:MAG: T9SS type A sorting domain-containing protein, partial [Bacteroidales bacterium]|nr:T9SS type A sorting domain-containing protein [Bacteroidales bacterium]
NAHVRLEGVRDPLFLGCQFSDGRHGGATNTFGSGISAYRSGMVVDRYETTPGNYVESIFSNFRTAIMMENNVERFTAVRHTAFQNNLVGIHALATMYMVCVGNNFQISNPIPQTVGNAYGLLLEQSGGAVVRDNDFFSSNLPGTAGVLVRSSGAEAWSIRNNSFHQLCAGVLVSGCNADFSSDTASCGLTACCNEFRNNGSSLHIMEGSTLALAQGASGHAAGNLFMNSTADIRKLNTQKMVYYYNGNGTNHRPDRISGDVGNVTVLQTFSDDCDGAYGISPDNPLSGVYTGVSLPDLGQRFIELRQEYVESQEGYEGMYPGSGMTSGTLVGQAQRNAFALMQWRRQQLSDICAEAVLHIISDTVFDWPAYVQWLGNSHSPRAAYALLEDAYVNDPVTFNQLALSIPDDYASLDAGEYSSLLQLYAVRKPADSLGCGWANLDGNAVAVLENVAGRDDYAGAVAKSVLDNHYGEAYLYNNQHPAWPYELDCMWRRDSTTTDSTDIDTTGHKLLMSLTDQDSLSDTLPQRTSYMSFFGKKNTVWSLTFHITHACWNNFLEVLSDSGMKSAPFDVENLKNNLDFFANREQQCACFSETDTVNYTVLADPTSSGTLPLSLRVLKLSLKNVSDTFTYNGHSYTGISGEDTVNGRLYRLYYDSIEVLWCDMSLTLGDTFRFPDLTAFAHYKDDWEYMGQGSCWIVDSVYYLDNRKIIRFELVQGKTPWWYRKLPLYFIEGIGPTYGPFGKLWEDYTMDYGPELPLLLCVYKDDTLDFMSSSAWGCRSFGGPGWYFEDDAVKEPKRTTLTLQPNPAQDYIMLRNEDASDLGGEIIITDAIGRVMRHCTMENAEMRINIGSYGYGTYFVRYRSKNGVQILKFVKVE